jgi:hypothetical protein
MLADRGQYADISSAIWSSPRLGDEEQLDSFR